MAEKDILKYFVCKIPEAKTFTDLQVFCSITKESCKNASFENILLNNAILIEQSAFENCKNLGLVIWKGNIPKLGTIISSVNIEEYAYKIGTDPLLSILIQNSAFKGCDKLETVIFPKNKCIIEKDAFAQCKSLRTIVFPGGDTEIVGEPFIGCNNLTIVCDKNDFKIQAYARAHSFRIIELN